MKTTFTCQYAQIHSRASHLTCAISIHIIEMNDYNFHNMVEYFVEAFIDYLSVLSVSSKLC